MRNKFILQEFENGLIVRSTEFESLKEIAKRIPALDYHQLRTLYNHGKKPTKLHPFLKSASEMIKIIDIPKIKLKLEVIQLPVVD
jgi:hypothetical protein